MMTCMTSEGGKVHLSAGEDELVQLMLELTEQLYNTSPCNA